jgi:vancomycin resistance protein YoaR
MLNQIISALLVASLILRGEANATVSAQKEKKDLFKWETIASKSIDLSYRYPEPAISNGFKENILIATDYLNKVGSGVIILNPGEVFSFHKNILPEYEGQKIITQESGFMVNDGYKVVAGLGGNGVCHLASLMNWTAQEAGLEVRAEVDHDFAAIPGIDSKYGTSIKFVPSGGLNSQKQNLYIRNNKDYSVWFLFELEGENLKFSILKF